MKLLKFLLPTTFLLLAVSSLSAQTDLPDANNSACWQSLTALHNCAQAQQERAMSQAERCTSYPEYQCEPETQPKVQEAKLQKQKSTSAAKSSTSAIQAKSDGANSKNVAAQGSSGGGGSEDQIH